MGGSFPLPQVADVKRVAFILCVVIPWWAGRESICSKGMLHGVNKERNEDSRTISWRKSLGALYRHQGRRRRVWRILTAACQETGVSFVRGRVAQVEEENGKTFIHYEGYTFGRDHSLSLLPCCACSGIGSEQRHSNIGNMLNLSTRPDRFFQKAAHPKMRPAGYP